MCTVEIFLLLCFTLGNVLSDITTDCNDTYVYLDTFEGTLTILMHRREKCNFEITGFRYTPFVGTFLEIDLQPPDPCSKNYVDVTTENTTRFCANNGTGMTFNSLKKTIFVTIEVETNATVVLRFTTIPEPVCGPYEVQLNSTTEMIDYDYPESVYCFYKIVGIPYHDFNMTIPKINFPPPPCDEGFVAADILPTDLWDAKYKKCGNTSVMEPIKSFTSNLYLLISAGPNDSVSLKFDTLFPECGQPEISITEFPTLVTFPPKGQAFTNYTQCLIKVDNTQQTRTKLRTKSIKFPSDCKNNYVKVSQTMDGLKNTTYIKCGSMAGRNSIFSNKTGVLYILIYLQSIDVETPYVTFEFNSGVDRPRQYVLVALLIYMLLSATMY